MAKVGLIHGAFLVESEGHFYQVGDVKEPANYEKFGFVTPESFDPMQQNFVELEICGEPKISEPCLSFKDDGEDFCNKLHQRLVIKRNASTSVRMWYLFFDAEEYAGQKVIDLQWLMEIPEEIWEIIQDEVWTC